MPERVEIEVCQLLLGGDVRGLVETLGVGGEDAPELLVRDGGADLLDELFALDYPTA